MSKASSLLEALLWLIWCDDMKEITKEMALFRKEVEIESYIRKCPTCYFFDSKDYVCDMCDQGGFSVINNHGKRPSKVNNCSVYTKKDK